MEKLDSEKSIGLLGHCQRCGEDIYEGERHFDFDTELVCDDCMVDYVVDCFYRPG